MAGFVYNPAEFEKFPVEIVENGKTVKFELPLLGYIPREITEYADAKIVERANEVQAARDERHEKKLVIIEADPAMAYPTNLDGMEWMLEMIEPALHDHVIKWPNRSRTELWNAWQEASKIPAEKSEASSDSSDATE